MDSEKFNDYLAHQDIKWQFNLSRAPWWGGQFERIIGLVKQSLYKSIGKTFLSFNELEEVLLDVEQTLNNRPLCYVEDDIQSPTLTPNSLIYGDSNFVPSVESSHLIPKGDLRKRFRYISRCKDYVWNRWTREYVKGLRERHNLKYGKNSKKPKIGDVVIIKGDEKNRGKWKLGIITFTYPGNDGIIRAVELRTKSGNLQRPVQFLYPLELSVDINGLNSNSKNDHVNEYNIRPKRNAAAEIAKLKFRVDLIAMDDI